MRSEIRRTDPLAPLALAVVAVPLLILVAGAPVSLPCLTAGVLSGGCLGVVSLLRIGRAGGRLRGLVPAIAAVVGGFGLLALLAVFACFWVAVALAGGE